MTNKDDDDDDDDNMIGWAQPKLLEFLTSSITSHGIGIRTRYRNRCRSEVSVPEVSVQSGISLSLVVNNPDPKRMILGVSFRDICPQVVTCYNGL